MYVCIPSFILHLFDMYIYSHINNRHIKLLQQYIYIHTSTTTTPTNQLRGSAPWLLLFFISTLYQTYWDVAQDWGIVTWEEIDDRTLR